MPRVTGVLASPLATVRAKTLAMLKRETFLNYEEAVLARLGDAAPDVRLAVAEALSRPELPRLRETLRPLPDAAA